jgi:hypothetical protein
MRTIESEAKSFAPTKGNTKKVVVVKIIPAMLISIFLTRLSLAIRTINSIVIQNATQVKIENINSTKANSRYIGMTSAISLMDVCLSKTPIEKNKTGAVNTAVIQTLKLYQTGSETGLLRSNFIVRPILKFPGL